MTLRAGDLAKEKEERFVNEQKHFEIAERQSMRGKRGEKRGLGSVEELWVNKACCGEEERDS